MPASRATPELDSNPPPAATPVAQPAKPVSTAILPLVPLMTLAEGWPEDVCKEIVQLELVSAKVGLPVEDIQQALRQGRVSSSWQTVRSWIKPAPLSMVSPHDAVMLDLPLKVVTPLFMAHQKVAKQSQEKVAVDETIPNLFFGFPQTEAAPISTPRASAPAVPSPAAPVSAASAPAAPAPAKPVDTNYYVWEDDSDQPRANEVEVKPASTPGTKFTGRFSTPNEVIARAAALEGVSGALIALPDGLMVASQLAPDLNGETLAAFLPQIFGKVSQCTKELRMGELNNLNFTVGNIPWKIFRVNAIFFAAFGKPGAPLPTSQLAALASELDHKPK